MFSFVSRQHRMDTTKHSGVGNVSFWFQYTWVFCLHVCLCFCPVTANNLKQPSYSPPSVIFPLRVFQGIISPLAYWLSTKSSSQHPSKFFYLPVGPSNTLSNKSGFFFSPPIKFKSHCWDMGSGLHSSKLIPSLNCLPQP